MSFVFSISFSKTFTNYWQHPEVLIGRVLSSLYVPISDIDNDSLFTHKENVHNFSVALLELTSPTKNYLIYRRWTEQTR